MKRLTKGAGILCAVILACFHISAAAGKEAGNPTGLYADKDRLFITDNTNHVIYTLENGKTAIYAGKIGVTDIYGNPGGGYHDASLKGAYFQNPWAMTAYLEGYAVTDTGNNVIRYIKGNKVYTAAGNMAAGYKDGKAKDARFNSPRGITADDEGNLYIADTLNHVIRKMTPEGMVSTYAGGIGGYQDGDLSAARFCEPSGICWDQGILYVADTGNQRIRMIKDGRVTTISGNPVFYEGTQVYAGGWMDGSAKEAQYDNPTGIIARDGVIYVADTGNSAIRRIKNFRVTTLQRLMPGSKSLYPAQPSAFAFSGQKLYAADKFTGRVYSLKNSLWKSAADQRLGKLIKALPADVTKNSGPISINPTRKQVTIESLGDSLIPVTITKPGICKITVYGNRADKTLAVYKGTDKKEQAAALVLKESQYDGAVSAYRADALFTVNKAGTYYLLADKGAYGADIQVYSSQSRTLKEKAWMTGTNRNGQEGVYFKYQPEKSGTITIQMRFLNLNSTEKAGGSVVLCCSSKKESSQKLMASTDNGVNSKSFRVLKGKTYYFKAAAEGAFQIKGTFAAKKK